MFDVTNKLSFDSLEYWLQEFTSNGGKQAITALVANKVRHVHYSIFELRTVPITFVTVLRIRSAHLEIV